MSINKPESIVYFGLGGNIGDVVANMQQALSFIAGRDDCRLVAVSKLYSTPPWGIVDQPRFINACASLTTTLEPHQLLDVLQLAENNAGRVRGERFGPRTLDLDVLAYGDGRILDTSRLNVPHPRMLERSFVLLPLSDIAPDLLIDGKKLSHWLAQCDLSGVEVLDEQLAI